MRSLVKRVKPVPGLRGGGGGGSLYIIPLKTWALGAPPSFLDLHHLRTFFVLSAILGLTVLALGNCVADWVADTVVTRAGKPEMAFASCFGSPLLSHVLGLSIAMIVREVLP